MKKLKILTAVVVGQFLMISQAFAVCSSEDLTCASNGVAVPEIDGSGAIIAIGLVAGLVALIREKFYRN